MHITIGIEIDYHVLVWISMMAVVCDLLGGLYLAYDLLKQSSLLQYCLVGESRPMNVPSDKTVPIIRPFSWLPL